jgi:hypothetical protein
MASGIFSRRNINQLRTLGGLPGVAPPFVEYLVVAGGGGGSNSGGGGAGGLLMGIVPVVAGTSYTVTVGTGGAGSATVGTYGVNSVFGSISSNGGGGGGGYAGGGAGGGSNGTVTATTLIGGQGTSGQGFAGGSNATTASSAGGGGAGTVGLNGVSATIQGPGGAGIASSISGIVVAYSGGGGGGTNPGTGGPGGVGGGGAGASSSADGTAGTTNTGGGGGGAAGAAKIGGAGGSGIVIVRYPGNIQFYTGGTVHASSDGIVHVFKSSGTLTPTTPITIKPWPVTIGASYGGGYFAGQITQSGTVYNLIVSPKASGENTAKQWASGSSVTGFTSLVDGPTNSAGLAALGAGYAAATFCEGLSIGGYTDWYLPARDELETAFYYLKNSAIANYTAGGNLGSNANAVSPEPTSTNYTATIPPQTTVSGFRVGGSEAFASQTHWSSSESTSANAWLQYFVDTTDSGAQVADPKTGSLAVRAFRRVAA